MLGALAGDIIASAYEYKTEKLPYNFNMFAKRSHFTDDTILTIATAESILTGEPFRNTIKKYFLLYPNLSYDGYLLGWLLSPKPQPYDEYGSRVASRISPFGWAYNTLGNVLEMSRNNAEITHYHREGIKGAQAVAGTVFLARTGASKAEIKSFIEKKFKYDLGFDMAKLIKNYKFTDKCQEIVPQAIFTFLQSNDFSDSIRLTIQIGGNSNSLACINGAIAEAFYKTIPKKIVNFVMNNIDDRVKSVAELFTSELINKD